MSRAAHPARPGWCSFRPRIRTTGPATSDAIKTFVATVEDGAALLLDKIQGIGHGGGEQVPIDSEEFDNVAWFLDLVRREARAVAASAETLFDNITLASARKTLRRTALIFAGRLPTPAEYDALDAGTLDLPEAIRNLMTGPRFHEFLLRAANDRLLTDRYADDNTLENRGYFFHFDNKYFRLRKAVVDTGQGRAFNEWHNAVQYGVARAPLELIAHVVENDLPYTEILTADYVMANRMAAETYTGAPALFGADNVHEFRRTRITDYYRRAAGYSATFEPNIGVRILSRGSGKTAIPHAGILNTLVFLKRYPTTATNRNRARARWAYYHFLGVDIENAASRTTDPRGIGGYRQSDHAQRQLHRMPQRHGPGGWSLPRTTAISGCTATNPGDWIRWTASTRTRSAKSSKSRPPRSKTGRPSPAPVALDGPQPGLRRLRERLLGGGYRYRPQPAPGHPRTSRPPRRGRGRDRPGDLDRPELRPSGRGRRRRQRRPLGDLHRDAGYASTWRFRPVEPIRLQ